jgi:hypothetical protein
MKAVPLAVELKLSEVWNEPIRRDKYVFIFDDGPQISNIIFSLKSRDLHV